MTSTGDIVRKGDCPHCGAAVTIREVAESNDNVMTFHATVHHDGRLGEECAAFMDALREELKGLLALKVKQMRENMDRILERASDPDAYQLPEWARKQARLGKQPVLKEPAGRPPFVCLCPASSMFEPPGLAYCPVHNPLPRVDPPEWTL